MTIFAQSPTSTLVLTQTVARPATLSISVLHNMSLLQNCEGDHSQYLDAYGTLIEANTYFDNRLRSVAWKRARNEDKMSAMREATQMIDRLNFAGNKTNATQVHQFPRVPSPVPTNIVIDQNGLPVLASTLQDPADTTIPTDIKRACFEIAMKLIQGYDPDREADLLTVESVSYSQVRTSYKREFIPDYQRAGIPSFRAWSYLAPYLRDPGDLIINRG